MNALHWKIATPLAEIINFCLVWIPATLLPPAIQIQPHTFDALMEGHWKMKVTIYFVKTDDHCSSVPKDCNHRPCKDVVQTPMCPRSNNIIVSLFINLVPTTSFNALQGRMGKCAGQLPKSCSDQGPCQGLVPEHYPLRRCPCLNTVLRFLLGHQKRAMLRLVSMPKHWTQVCSLNGALKTRVCLATKFLILYVWV